MKQTMRLTRSLVVASILTALLFGASLFFTHNAHAQAGIPGTGVEITGYAWSETIGWISLNCRTGGATGNDICGTSSYRVTATPAGALTGFAWSSNIGWIKFNGLSGFPVVTGTVAASAQVTGTYPGLTFRGWARACAGTATGDCNTMTSRTDGWDGWISLRSTVAPTYSTVMSGTGALSNSFAWGSDVLGWVDFDLIAFRMPTATLNATNCAIPLGASTCNSSMTWNIADATVPNLRNSTRGVTYSTAAAGNAVPYAITFGSNVIQARDANVVLQSRTVTGTCATGTSYSNGTTCEYPAPVITLSTSRAIVRTGETVQVTWTLNPSPVASGSCALTGPGMTNSINTSGTRQSADLSSKTRFTMTCTGPYGSVSSSTEVELIPVAREV